MKQILVPTLRLRLEYLIDSIIERIIDIADYFVVVKHITLSEWILFGIAFVRAAWFILFGAIDHNYDLYLPSLFWTSIFAGLTLLHFSGFFFKSLNVRIVAVYGHSFVWGFLTLLALYARADAPAAPQLFIFTILSAILVVRLSSDKNNV